MKIFLDTADISEIKEALDWGVIDGVTTNPASIARIRGRSLEDILNEIVHVVSGPVSAQVVARTSDEMIEQGINLAKIAPNIVVKIPISPEGLIAIRKLSELDIATHCTLVFSAVQALLAAKAGATYVSPFVARLNAIGTSGVEVVAQIVTILENYGFDTEVMAASVKDPSQVLDIAISGADACTIPMDVLRALSRHPLTDELADRFLRDWRSGTTMLDDTGVAGDSGLTR
ncbi:MAG: fructose-6-phosphate aldolase [Candidatus Zixiibacteriota bacterium]